MKNEYKLHSLKMQSEIQVVHYNQSSGSNCRYFLTHHLVVIGHKCHASVFSSVVQVPLQKCHSLDIFFVMIPHFLNQ